MKSWRATCRRPREANALWDLADAASLLHAACFNGHVDVARYLLQQGAAADCCMVNGATPLFAAAQEGHAAVVCLAHVAQTPPPPPCPLAPGPNVTA